MLDMFPVGCLVMFTIVKEFASLMSSYVTIVIMSSDLKVH
jgi:hypothetical protein